MGGQEPAPRLHELDLADIVRHTTVEASDVDMDLAARAREHVELCAVYVARGQSWRQSKK